MFTVPFESRLCQFDFQAKEVMSERSYEGGRQHIGKLQGLEYGC